MRKTDGATSTAAAVIALADFKNPFNTATAAVVVQQQLLVTEFCEIKMMDQMLQ